MHLDLLDPTSFTGLTSSSFGIETESSDPVPTLLCFKRCREDFTDMGKEPRIGSDIGMRSTTNRRLIDQDDFIQLLGSFYLRDLSYCDSISCAQFICQMRGEYIHDQGRFSRTRYSCYD